MKPVKKKKFLKKSENKIRRENRRECARPGTGEAQVHIESSERGSGVLSELERVQETVREHRREVVHLLTGASGQADRAEEDHQSGPDEQAGPAHTVVEQRDRQVHVQKRQGLQGRHVSDHERHDRVLAAQ